MLKIFIYVVFILLIVQTINLFSKIIKSHKREKSGLYHKVMSEQLDLILRWSYEIANSEIKQEFTTYCIDYIYNRIDKTKNINNEFLKLKEEVSRKYINHIPSLKSEEREKKLNSLLCK